MSISGFLETRRPRNASRRFGLMWSSFAARNSVAALAVVASLGATGGVGEPAGGVQTADHFASISSGMMSSCGLLGNGRVVCWGYVSNPPLGRFSAVSVNSGSGGEEPICGILRTAGRGGPLSCWNIDPTDHVYDPPPGRFVQVAEADCGVTVDSRAECWSGPGVQTLPGRFVSVSGAPDGRAVCGVRLDLSAGCWNGDRALDDDVPAGPFREVAVGEHEASGDWMSASFACGVRTEGAVACWGHLAQDGIHPPSGRFTEVTAGVGFACGSAVTGSVACWGKKAPHPPAGSITQVSAGVFNVCGLRSDGNATCWGHDSSGGTMPTPPGRPIKTVAAGTGDFGCQIYQAGRLACWGGGSYDDPPPPMFSGRYIHASVGSDVACGLRVDLTIICGGGKQFGSPPSGQFRNISLGRTSGCAVRVSGTLACWGVQGPGLNPVLKPPPGRFLQVALGTGGTWDFACAIRVTGSLDCWGDHSALYLTNDGVTQPPSGHFSGISGWLYSACGLRSSGLAVCWGEIGRRHDAPMQPSNQHFVQMGGGSDGCGLRSDHVMFCWGWGGDLNGRVPQPGKYTSIEVGGGVCGVELNGTLRCGGQPLLMFGVYATLIPAAGSQY